MSFNPVFVFLSVCFLCFGFYSVSLGHAKRECTSEHHMSTWTLQTRAAQRELLLCTSVMKGILLFLPFIFSYHFLKLENCEAWLRCVPRAWGCYWSIFLRTTLVLYFLFEKETPISSQLSQKISHKESK